MATYLEYIKTAMNHAEYEWIEDGGVYFAHIPGLAGLWALGETKEDTEKDLYGALDSWLDVHIKIGHHQPPEIDGINLTEPPRKIG